MWLNLKIAYLEILQFIWKLTSTEANWRKEPVDAYANWRHE